MYKVHINVVVSHEVNIILLNYSLQHCCMHRWHVNNLERGFHFIWGKHFTGIMHLNAVRLL